MALSGLHLDAMEGRLREVFFFDPGEVPLVELSTKTTPQNVLQVFAEGVRFVRDHGLSASGAQEPKTRKALEFFARQHGGRSRKDG
jgi:isopropylmalate/homocitrate/citramalate synthase